jgi:hypothetical protein
MENVINKFNNNLIIIHTNHLKNEKIMKILKNKIYFATPKGFNDDIFIIMAYLYNNSKIISNDNYKDHTIDNYYFRNYLNDDLIKYSNKEGFFVFEEEINYSHCIQIIDDKIYIPGKKGFIKIN